MNSITTELWPVASRVPEGISSHSSQRFDTTKQKESDFSAHTQTLSLHHDHTSNHGVVIYSIFQA